MRHNTKNYVSTFEKASLMKMMAMRKAKFSSVKRVMTHTKALASVATHIKRMNPTQIPIQNLKARYSQP